MSKLSSFFGFLVALYVLPFVLVPLLMSPQQPGAVTPVPFTHLLAYVGITLACAMLVKFFIMVAAVALTRGRDAFGWAHPRQCRSVLQWLGFQWSFYSQGGFQRGFRVLGLEVAMCGKL